MNAFTPIPRLTAIASGKGGTGKTLIALGLAQALARQGERVLLCDADLGLSNTTVHLGLPDCGDLAGVLAGRLPMEKGAIAVNGGASSHGFDLLATGRLRRPRRYGFRKRCAPGGSAAQGARL